MKTTPDNASKTPDLSGLSTAEMMAVISNLKEQLAAKDDILQRQLKERDETIEPVSYTHLTLPTIYSV